MQANRRERIVVESVDNVQGDCNVCVSQAKDIMDIKNEDSTSVLPMEEDSTIQIMTSMVQRSPGHRGAQNLQCQQTLQCAGNVSENQVCENIFYVISK